MRPLSVSPTSRRRPGGRSAAGLLLGLALVGGPLAAIAAGTDKADRQSIYSCTTPDGRRLSSDRPIRECIDQMQRLLNHDGSTRAMVPPAQSDIEKAQEAERRRREYEARLQREDAARRDIGLLVRYPEPSVHDRARAAALEPSQRGIDATLERMVELNARKRAYDERIAKGEALTSAERRELGDLEAQTAAQSSVLRLHQSEHDRVAQRFDEERARLERLWEGAEPGSLELRSSASR